MRRCMRYKPEDLRIRPGISDYALDLLAKRRKSGERLAAETTAILDELRPDGAYTQAGLGGRLAAFAAGSDVGLVC